MGGMGGMGGGVGGMGGGMGGMGGGMGGMGGGGGGGGGIGASNETSFGNPLSAMCSYSYLEKPSAPTAAGPMPVLGGATYLTTQSGTTTEKRATSDEAPLALALGAAAAPVVADAATAPVVTASGGTGTILSEAEWLAPATLKQKVERLQFELSLPAGEGIVATLQQASACLGTQVSGTPQEQATVLLHELGI